MLLKTISSSISQGFCMQLAAFNENLGNRSPGYSEPLHSLQPLPMLYGQLGTFTLTEPHRVHRSFAS
jgi:hypothetical protein